MRHSITAILLFMVLAGNAQTKHRNDYLFAIRDTANDRCGFINAKGDTIIPAGKYFHCFTDTLRDYAVVISDAEGMVAIDRHDSILYHVFIFDNGPDYASDGLFRIAEKGKIGYANAVTGKVVIKPQFSCAYPFEHGKAQVSNDCSTSKFDEEHSTWQSDHWFFINKKGNKVAKPKASK